MQNMTSSYLSPEVQEKQLRAQLGKDYEGLKARADQMGMSLQEFTSKIGTNLERINQDISNALKAGAPSASSGGAPVNVTDASDKSVRTTNASAYAGSPSLNTNDTEAVIF